MDANEVAQYIGLSVWSVRRKASEDTDFPKPAKVGMIVRWDRKEVEKWWDRQKAFGKKRLGY